jgi:hypothetical protein
MVIHTIRLVWLSNCGRSRTKPTMSRWTEWVHAKILIIFSYIFRFRIGNLVKSCWLTTSQPILSGVKRIALWRSSRKDLSCISRSRVQKRFVKRWSHIWKWSTSVLSQPWHLFCGICSAFSIINRVDRYILCMLLAHNSTMHYRNQAHGRFACNTVCMPGKKPVDMIV